MTDYQAITQLREQGIVYTRHGSGVFVAEQQAAHSLFPAVSRAVEAHEIAIDAMAPNARLLAGALRAPLARVVAGLDTPPSGTIRLLAAAVASDDYAYHHLRDELTLFPGLSFDRRTIGPSSQFGFVLVNDTDLFLGLSSDNHASLPPQVLAEQLLHASTVDTAGINQISAVKE